VNPLKLPLRLSICTIQVILLLFCTYSEANVVLSNNENSPTGVESTSIYGYYGVMGDAGGFNYTPRYLNLYQQINTGSTESILKSISLSLNSYKSGTPSGLPLVVSLQQEVPTQYTTTQTTGSIVTGTLTTVSQTVTVDALVNVGELSSIPIDTAGIYIFESQSILNLAPNSTYFLKMSFQTLPQRYYGISFLDYNYSFDTTDNIYNYNSDGWSLGSLYLQDDSYYPLNIFGPSYQLNAIDKYNSLVSDKLILSVDATVIPEPSTYALFGLGGIVVFVSIRRRKALVA
jgi:hypothetical protein